MALLTLEGLPSKSSLILRDNKQLILEIENSRLHPSPIHSSIWFLHSGALFPSPNHPQGLPRGINGKESACNVGGVGLISGSGRSPRGGNGNPLQYSCLENSMNRGAWQDRKELDTTEQLTHTHTYAHTHTHTHMSCLKVWKVILEVNHLL